MIRCELMNMKTSQKYRFFIRNETGVNLLSGWNLYITPITYTPKA